MTVYYTEFATSNKTDAGTDMHIDIKIHGDTGVTTKMPLVIDVFKKGAWV